MRLSNLFDNQQDNDNAAIDRDTNSSKGLLPSYYVDEKDNLSFKDNEITAIEEPIVYAYNAKNNSLM